MTADAGIEACPAASPDELDARWALVLPHQERLRRIAARRLACRDEVDDVVQEAMLRAVTFERLDPAYAGQFLSTVTVRLCADVQRDRARQLRVGVRDALRTVDPADPHDTLLDTAEARWLYGECLKLPPRESAVMLARANGMSVKDAATTLGVGTKSAEAALTKARHRMRRVAQSAGVTVLGVLKRFKLAGAPAVAAGVTAATIGGVVGGAVLLQPDGRPPAPPAQSRSISAAARPPALAMAPVKPVTDRVVKTVRSVVVAGAPKPPNNPPGPRTDLETEPIGDPNVVGTREGVKVTHEREDETFEETVVRCVGDILTIDPQHPVCDPE